MSAGLSVLAKTLETGSANMLRRIEESLFLETELSTYRYITRHFSSYGVLPSIDAVQTATGVELPATPDTLEYYFKRLTDRNLYNQIREPFATLRDSLRDNDMDAVRAVVDDLQTTVRVHSPDNDLRNLREAAAAVREDYAAAHLSPGLTGVPSGYPTLDNATGGYQLADLVSYVARLGVGKSNILVFQSHSAWKAGYNVLFVSMEMTIPQIARRLIALDSGMNPDYIRKGSLSSRMESQLNDHITHLASGDRFHIFSGNFKKKISDLSVIIEQTSPDIVYIDGAYLLKPSAGRKNGTKFSDVTDVYDELKELTIVKNRPIITTTQFSRAAGARGKDGSIESVGYSDSISTNSSIMVFVKEGPAPYTETRRRLEIGKGREGEKGSFVTHYIFTPPKFSEVGEGEDGRIDLDWTA